MSHTERTEQTNWSTTKRNEFLFIYRPVPQQRLSTQLHRHSIFVCVAAWCVCVLYVVWRM